MEQYLFNLNQPGDEDASEAVVGPNVWLLSADEVPPLLFTPDDVSRLLGLSKHRVFDLIRTKELRSIKIGALRRISAKALHDFVEGLELSESA